MEMRSQHLQYNTYYGYFGEMNLITSRKYGN